MNPVLVAEGLRVRYRDTVALEMPYLALRAGEVLAVLGPNGSGKSTLLRVLAALQGPDAGHLTFRGRRLNWYHTLAYRRRIAVVLQEPLLLDTSVWRNVALGWYLRGRWGKDVADRVQTWMARFHIQHLAHQSALTLSGGEARRVALARAFALEPEILFLDEPFSGLDGPTREALLLDLRHVLQTRSTTTLLVTHDREEALALADRIAVLMDGQIRQIGLPEDVSLRPVDLAVARFVGMENLLPARVAGKWGENVQLCLEDGTRVESKSPGSHGGNVWIGIRPEHVRLNSRSHAGRNVWPARVVAVAPLGFRVKLTLQLRQVQLTAFVAYDEWAQQRLTKGASTYVVVDPSHVHVFPRGCTEGADHSSRGGHHATTV